MSYRNRRGFVLSRSSSVVDVTYQSPAFGNRNVNKVKYVGYAYGQRGLKFC